MLSVVRGVMGFVDEFEVPPLTPEGVGFRLSYGSDDSYWFLIGAENSARLCYR